MIKETKEHYLNQLATMIRQGRENAGVTQVELANELNISLRTFQRIEKGESEPTLSELYLISKTIRVPLEFFLYSSTTLKDFGIGRWEYLEKQKLLYASEAIFDIYDIDPNEKITEAMLIDRVYQEDRNRFTDHFKRYDQQKSIYDIEYRIYSPGGTKWILQRCLNIFDANGSKIKRIGFVFDVSKCKECPNCPT